MIVVSVATMYLEDELIDAIRYGVGVPHAQLSVLDRCFAVGEELPFSRWVGIGRVTDLVPGKPWVRGRADDGNLAAQDAARGGRTDQTRALLLLIGRRSIKRHEMDAPQAQDRHSVSIGKYIILLVFPEFASGQVHLADLVDIKKIKSLA
jgi:hypothetical protein